MTQTRTDPSSFRPWLAPADRPPCCEQPDKFLRVESLGVSYEGRQALRDVSLAIYQGCITAVVGPSGCGKTSFLNCLNRMVDLTRGASVSGSVQIGESEILNGHTDLVSLRRRVGMIFQKPNPFPLSVRKNITFPLKQTRGASPRGVSRGGGNNASRRRPMG